MQIQGCSQKFSKFLYGILDFFLNNPSKLKNFFLRMFENGLESEIFENMSEQNGIWDIEPYVGESAGAKESPLWPSG